MVRPLALVVFVLALFAPLGTAEAQAVSVRAPYPAVTAADRDWLHSGQPILFAGDRYYPAGPSVHYQPDLMLRTGSYDGVPLYADTSVEPYSQVLVPIGKGLLQPYERRREGALAGTTGSRTPSFPVQMRPDVAPQGAAWQDDSPPQPAGRRPAAAIGAPPEEEGSRGLVSARTPQGNRGIWIQYEGRRWEAAGEAVALDATFQRVGAYHGFPVYARGGGAPAASEIYIPSRDDMLAPYKAAGGN